MRVLKRHFPLLLAVLFFGLLVWHLLRSWYTLPPSFFQTLKIAPLVGSLVALIVAFPFVSLRWWLTLYVIGVPVGVRDAVRIWFLSQAGRYAPGGVWNYIARFYLGKTEIPGQAIVTSMVLETELRVLSEALVFLFSIPLWPRREFFDKSVLYLIVGGIVACLGLLHPTFLNWFTNRRIIRQAGFKDIDFSGVRYHTMLGLLVYYMLSVIMIGGAFYLLVTAFYPVSVNLILPLSGILAASVVLGFLFPLVPNGWGVREGVLTFLLSQVLPTPVAILVAIFSRIWLTGGEVFWIVLMGIQRRKTK